MRRFAVGLATLGAAVGLMAGGACDGGTTASGGAVRIDSISPSSGTIGTEMVIQGAGFDPLQNDIGFSRDFDPGFDTAFISSVPSPDEKTLRFALPETLGACAVSQMAPDEACPSVGLGLRKGVTEVTVHNHNGTSEPVRFTRELSTMEAAQEAINNSPEEYEGLRQLAHDIMLDSFTLDSFDPSVGHYANTTRLDLRASETGDEAYIEFEIKGSHVSALENEIPDEINGVEVRVVRDE